MSIETAIQNLADAINRMCDMEQGKPAGAGATTESDPPARRGRPKKTDTPDAAAADPPSSADTASPAPVSTTDASAAAPAPAVTVDAGTGQPIEAAPAADAAASEVDRKGAKQKAGKLVAMDGGDVKLTTLLRKHSGIAEGEVKFGNVPDEAIPAFAADVDAELALAD